MSRGEDKTNSLMSSCYSSRTIFHGGEENENERERKREMRQEYVVSSPHEFPWTRARSIGEEIEREREREAQNGAEAVVQKGAPFVRASW